MFKANIQGLDALRNYLQNFPKAVREELLEVSGKQAGKIVKDQIVEEMAHAFNAYSGNLHKTSSIAVESKAQSADEVLISVGPRKKYFYSYFLEYGTENMPAKPFFRRAFDASIGRVLDYFRQKLINAAHKRRRGYSGYSEKFGKFKD